MTEKVCLERREHLPVPLIYLASAEDLAAWYVSGLLWSLEHGERALAISCFDTQRAFGFSMDQAAQTVLRAVTDVLYGHPEAESLTILCGDGESWRAYNFWWNMLYAEHRPAHEQQGIFPPKILTERTGEGIV
jgi:O-acetyl-ADP-ribose deacetylase (regulator of RNase III)